MRFNFNYSKKPALTDCNAKDFSNGTYECQFLMQTMKGQPVAIFHNTEMDIWKVQYGYSTVFFGTYADAMDFCRRRFCEIPSEKVRKRK